MNKYKNFSEWEEIIEKLYVNELLLGHQWFSGSVTKEFLNKEYISQYKQENLNMKFEGKGKFSTIAFQLLTVSAFLETYPFIDPKLGNAFIDMLHNAMCKENKYEIYSYLKRYHEVVPDHQAIVARFSHDITQHILGKKELDQEVTIGSIRLLMFISPFAYLTQWIAAQCFGDEKLAKELYEKVK